MTDNSDRGNSRPVATLIAITSLIFVLGGFIYWFVNPIRVKNRLEILDRTKLEDGKDLILAQSYNGSFGEPSTITVYQQVQSNLWISHYIDHESSYWRSGKLLPINNQRSRFVVFRGDKPIAEIDCMTRTSWPTWSTQLVSKASLLDQSPVENPNRRPQSVGTFQD